MFERRSSRITLLASGPSRRFGLLLLPFVWLGLTACDPGQSGQGSEAAAANSTDEQSPEASEVLQPASGWSCSSEPGRAPSGQMRAERVPGSQSDRDEPGLYEGPVWIDGALYFSDFTFAEGFPSRIQRLTFEGVLETVIVDSGSNGLAVDDEGHIMAATHDLKAISRYNRQTGERTIIWDEYAGEPFNSPNDLMLTRDGRIYFTDPDFQRSAAPGGQPETRVKPAPQRPPGAAAQHFLQGEVQQADRVRLRHLLHIYGIAAERLVVAGKNRAGGAQGSPKTTVGDGEIEVRHVHGRQLDSAQDH